MNRITIGFAAAFAGAAAYGINGPFARLAQLEGVSAGQLSLYRSIALVSLLGLAALVLKLPLLPPPGKRLAVLALALASSGVALGYLAAVAHTPFALAVTLLYTYPLMVFAMEAALTRRAPDPVRLAIFAVAFCGIVIAVGPELAGANPLGLGLAVFAAFANALLYVIAARVSAEGIGSLLMMQAIIGLASAALIAASGDGFSPFVFAVAPMASLVAGVLYALGFFSVFVAAPRIGSTSLSLAFLVEPVIGIIVAGWLLSEETSRLQWIGMGIILGALAIDLARQAFLAGARPR
jgi:drug/metabolite transporter (DMT)-like permease